MSSSAPRNAGCGAGPAFAGIDGGGTKTLCVVDHPASGRLGTGKAGPLNINYVSEDEARANITSAVQAACREAAVGPQALAVVSVAAPWAEHLVADVLTSLGASSARVEAQGEDASALMGAVLQPAGLVLTAGTGSRCAYLAPRCPGVPVQSTPVITGAWGSLFGDEGSGYAIGAAALRAVTQAWDGRGPATALASTIASHWRLTTEKDLVRVVYGPPAGAWRYRIASLCPVVGAAAGQGDGVAMRILRDAAEGLAAMVAACAAKAGLSGPLTVVPAGGVFGLGELITQPLLDALRLQGLTASLVTPELPPVYGALLLAETGGSPPDQDLTARLRSHNATQAGSGRAARLVYNGPQEAGGGGNIKY